MRLVVLLQKSYNPPFVRILLLSDIHANLEALDACLAAAPAYETAMNEQLRQIVAKKGKGDIASLLRAGDIWEVR